MNKPLVLVVEDDTPVRNLITTTLKTHEYRYLSAQNGASAVMEALSHNPDIVLLDLGLPDMDGVEIIRKIRSWSNMPIIVISARTEDSDKIGALDAGADDYLTKPISLKELLARVDAIERRLQQYTERRLTIGNVQLHLDQQELVVENSIRLSAYETRLMELLILNKEKDLSTQEIFQQIWGQEKDTDMDEGYVYIYISYLRQKLQAIQAKLKIIGQEGEMFRLVEVQEDA